MQIVMFLALGLLVFPSEVFAVAGPGLFLSAVLIFVARPIGVLACLLPFRMSLRKIAFVGWVGLRGAVPIILGTYPLIAGVPRAREIFNLVFFIVLTSVLVQGSTIPAAARLLGVSATLHRRPRAPIEFEQVDGMRGELIEVDLPSGSPVVGRRILEVGLPDEALVVLIGRDGRYLIPSGGTQLRAADRLFVLASDTALARVQRIVQPA
jgi:cell volume regulation protein A